jgi:hypothetical protein
MAQQDNINYFKKLVIYSTNFDTSAKWKFNSSSFTIFVESCNENDTIEYSFSGKEDEIHGEINPVFFKGICFDNRACNLIFFRRKTAGEPVTVRIEAWK